MIDMFLSALDGMFLLKAALGLTLGGLLGLAHFGLLGWNTRFFASGDVARAFFLQAARFLVLAAALFGISRLGATALLSAAAGIVIGRGLILRRARNMS